ncbi:MAG: YraN family protein [Lachnospiraceae bacterium]|nr:YraN family protein [Lachnospiraceae bacterium]
MTKQKNKRQVGGEKEAKVQDYLQKNGYEILGRNFFSRHGEIDIIAKKDGYLIFVEVKYRSGEAFGTPEEAVGFQKQKRIIAAAKYYLYRNGIPFDTPCRFDVVGVLGEEIRVTENAFGL